MLGLHCCTLAFTSFANRGYLCRGCTSFSLKWLHLLLSMLTLAGVGFTVVAHKLVVPRHGIFRDHGLNWCPLHCKMDSYPLAHQGSPYLPFNYNTWKSFKNTKHRLCARQQQPCSSEADVLEWRRELLTSLSLPPSQSTLPVLMEPQSRCLLSSSQQ